jgi:cysteinyl-tRNA synthetase
MIQSSSEYRASQHRISLYDSLGGAKINLDPIDSSAVSPEVKMYVCGLTPQDHPHLGHGLTSVRFDIVRRYLAYRRLNVNFVQNVTDIEDKIIEKSLSTGEDPIAMTRRFTDEFYRCLDQLQVLPVPRLTKVTEFVPEVITFVTGLIEKGMAYVTPEGNVYFDVRKKADYGKLSNQNVEMLFESVRKELDKQKSSPLDFALWKRDESTALSQPSPWGIGRPGWHIECSVMIYETLGKRIDIHGGGLDLKFPHHENEIAQSEAFTGEKFANVWMHSGLLNINGQKMSKSLNNFVRLTDGLSKFGASILRFVIARHHYRSSIDLTDKLFRDNLNSLLEFHRLFERVMPLEQLSEEHMSEPEVKALISSFEAAMNNDFNSPEALVALEQARNGIVQKLDTGKATPESLIPYVSAIFLLGNTLGLFFQKLTAVEQEGLHLVAELAGTLELSSGEISSVIQERNQARKEKNFQRSDEIRKSLADKGVEILDGRAGTTWRFV